MTLVVGFVVRDAAVMASDSQATEADDTRTLIDKIWLVRDFLFGFTGSGPVREYLEPLIAEAVEADLADRYAVRDALKVAIKPALEELYFGYARALPTEDPKAAIGGLLLAIGRDGDGYWLLEINEDASASFYTDRGFHAVGSGSAAAQIAVGMLENYVRPDLTLRQIEILAARSVSVCIRIVAHWLSEPLRLWSTENGGVFRQATDSELDDIERNVELWKGLERESIDEAVRRPVEEAPVATTPLPKEAPGHD